MTGRAGRRGRDNVGFVVAAPGIHQDPERIAQLLKAPPDALVSQFRATYTTLLNLLDAYGSFTSVREIAERSFAYRDFSRQIAQLEKSRIESEQKIQDALKEANCDISDFSCARSRETARRARPSPGSKTANARGGFLSLAQ